VNKGDVQIMKKALKALLIGTIGVVAGGVGMKILKSKDISAQGKITERYKEYYKLLNQWILLKNEGKNLQQYLIENNYRSIAIYGMGELGCRLYEELKNSDIEIKYAIDQNSDDISEELDIVTMDEDLEEVDAIIVTVTYAFDEIAAKLEDKVDTEIISLEDIVFDL
jgi:hypothetical protein